MQILIAVLILAVLGVGWWACKLYNCLQDAHRREKSYALDANKYREDAKDLREASARLQEGSKKRIESLEKRLSEVSKARDEAVQKLMRLQTPNPGAKVNDDTAEKRVKEIYKRIPRFADPARQDELDRRRSMILATLSDEDPTLYVLLSLIDEHESNEMDMGLKMGLSDGDRQYHAGRAASARDLAMAIRDVRLHGQQLLAQKKAA